MNTTVVNQLLNITKTAEKKCLFTISAKGKGKQPKLKADFGY